MKVCRFSAAVIAAAVMIALPLTSAWSATRAEAESAIADADKAREMAASAGGEWRDTGKMIKQATELLDTKEYTKAIGIAHKAEAQGELGYEQAMGQRDVGMPSYMTAASATEEPAVASMGGESGSMGLATFEVMHKGEKVVVERGHDKDATLPAEFLKTDRTCPPFCVQPMSAGAGVETVGEVELVAYLKQAAGGDTSVVVVDSRTPDWVMRGTIPGSINVPWDQVKQDQSGMFDDGSNRLLQIVLTEKFGVGESDGNWDFTDAKTLVLFCNGIWCGQSSANIGTLLELGYPAEKLKWYRGGMQDWVSVGLTTVKP